MRIISDCLCPLSLPLTRSDGSSHSSNATLPVSTAGLGASEGASPFAHPPQTGGYNAVPSQVWHRGRPNLHAQIAFLLSQRGMSGATELILTGGSAGGTSVFLGADFVAQLLPVHTKFVAAPDAGFFIDAAVWSNASAHAFRDEFISADSTMWDSTASGSLNAACLVAYAAEPWRCFFPEKAAPYIRTPWHSMMAAYDLASLSMIYDLPCLPPKCNATQLLALLAWRAPYIAALKPAVASYPGNGAFVDSCLVHEQNVAYCSGQSVPNCRGWNLYNVSAPGYPPALTPQQGFSLWYDATLASWERVRAERDAWGVLVEASLAAGADAYPTRGDRDVGGAQVVIIDPLEWPHNPSCPWTA